MMKDVNTTSSSNDDGGGVEGDGEHTIDPHQHHDHVVAVVAPTTTTSASTPSAARRLSKSMTPQTESLGSFSSSSSSSSSHESVEDETDTTTSSPPPLSTSLLSVQRPDQSEQDDKASPSASSSSSPSLSWSQQWTNLIRLTHIPVLWLLHAASRTSCRHPRKTVGAISFVSIGILLFAVYMPQFGIPLDSLSDQFFSSRQSPLTTQSRYLWGGRGGFTGRYRYFSLLLHGGKDENGNYRNILNSDFIEKSFTIIETMQSLPGYDKVCTQKKVTYVSPLTGQQDCEVYAVTRHWNHNVTAFRQTDPANVPAVISKSFFPDGQPASKTYLYGRYGEDNTTQIMDHLEMANIIFFLPSGGVARSWETAGLKAALGLRDQWQNDDIVLEVSAESSLSNEFERTIADDLPLVAVIFVMMSTFTAVAFCRCGDPVQSRALLGIGAVVTVLLSICAGFGIMFLTRVPFSNLTQMLPFIIFVRDGPTTTTNKQPLLIYSFVVLTMVNTTVAVALAAMIIIGTCTGSWSR
jgi:Patched family